jgi:hypothetical protein
LLNSCAKSAKKTDKHHNIYHTTSGATQTRNTTQKSQKQRTTYDFGDFDDVFDDVDMDVLRGDFAFFDVDDGSGADDLRGDFDDSNGTDADADGLGGFSFIALLALLAATFSAFFDAATAATAAATSALSAAARVFAVFFTAAAAVGYAGRGNHVFVDASHTCLRLTRKNVLKLESKMRKYLRLLVRHNEAGVQGAATTYSSMYSTTLHTRNKI